MLFYDIVELWSQERSSDQVMPRSIYPNFIKKGPKMFHKKFVSSFPGQEVWLILVVLDAWAGIVPSNFKQFSVFFGYRCQAPYQGCQRCLNHGVNPFPLIAITTWATVGRCSKVPMKERVSLLIWETRSNLMNDVQLFWRLFFIGLITEVDSKLIDRLWMNRYRHYGE